jgi:hypothetical protein
MLLALLFCLAPGCLARSAGEPPQVTKETCAVDDFAALYADYCGEQGIYLETHRAEMTAEDNERYFKYVDITPGEVYEQTGCKVFKVNSTCEAYIVHGGKLYHIGCGFGGWGVVDMATCDFDRDGRKDLIYTYSWGSGLHRSLVAVFNFGAMQETQLDYVHMNKDMMLEKISDEKFRLYDAAVEPKEHLDYCDFSLTKKDFLCEVVSKGDQPKVVAESNHS